MRHIRLTFLGCGSAFSNVSIWTAAACKVGNLTPQHCHGIFQRGVSRANTATKECIRRARFSAEHPLPHPTDPLKVARNSAPITAGSLTQTQHLNLIIRSNMLGALVLFGVVAMPSAQIQPSPRRASLGSYCVLPTPT